MHVFESPRYSFDVEIVQRMVLACPADQAIHLFDITIERSMNAVTTPA
jgi:hypothetical protein